MTKRLYFEDALQRQFEAVATDLRADQEGHWLCLNQTAFYPEGGGQPGDTGQLKSDTQVWQVKDTQVDEDGRIWHLLDGNSPPAIGAALAGALDWTRRYDHMQQHSGEHLIAGTLYELTGGFTHGLHIGKEISTIDVTMPGGEKRLESDMLAQIEALANQRIAQDSAITCRIPAPEELAALPLRKDPTVQEQVRVCAMGEFEMVACGGTHLARTGQIGLVKLLGSEPARGKLRLSFLCGQRANAHYAKVYDALSQARALLSAKEEEVPGRIEDLLRQMDSYKRELGALRRQASLDKLPSLIAGAQTMPDGRRLVAAELEENDLAALEAMASALVAHTRLMALLCVKSEGRWNLLFARSSDLDINMSDFIKATGAKGGGRPDFARGAATDSLPWEAARVMAPHF